MLYGECPCAISGNRCAEMAIFTWQYQLNTDEHLHPYIDETERLWPRSTPAGKFPPGPLESLG